MDAAALAAKRVGTSLRGKYHLEELLAVGGMAAVYRGRHRNGNRVAVKVLHASVCQQAELRDRFAREGCVANKVDHHGAVRVLDDDATEDGSVFLVMELLDGETLEKRWKRFGHRLPYREVAEVGIHLLDVLAAAHNQGIVHRDIKPENLFLTRQGALKVLDFGIARLRDLTGMGPTSTMGTGPVLGTPAYMPPEQVVGRPGDINGQTDIWATGATMFALISGQHVHEAASVSQLLVYAGSRAARSLASVAPDVPLAITHVIDRALAFEKADRWPSARAMQAALRAALDDVETPQLPTVREGLPWVSLKSTAPTARTVPPNTSTTGGLARPKGTGAGAVGRPDLRSSAPLLVGATAFVIAAAGLIVGLRERSEPQGHPAAATANLDADRAPARTARTTASGQPETSANIPAVAAESLPIAPPTTSPSSRAPHAPLAAPGATTPADDLEDNPYIERLLGTRPAPAASTAPTSAMATGPVDDGREVNPYLHRGGTTSAPERPSDDSR
jgi:serine/threonine protein kinase